MNCETDKTLYVDTKMVKFEYKMWVVYIRVKRKYLTLRFSVTTEGHTSLEIEATALSRVTVTFYSSFLGPFYQGPGKISSF